MAFKAGKVSSVPEELVDEAERLLMQFRQKTAEGVWCVRSANWLPRRCPGIVVALAVSLEAEQVKSGLAEFDYVTGGFHNTELDDRRRTAERREDGGDVADGPERGACREIGLVSSAWRCRACKC